MATAARKRAIAGKRQAGAQRHGMALRIYGEPVATSA
jgi:hypothetical protein